jgi:hypothetical protein
VSLHADDGILLWVKIRAPAQTFNGDLVLGQLTLAAKIPVTNVF